MIGSPRQLGLAALASAALAAAASACAADGPQSARDRGEAIFGANCAQCHGANLEGGDRGPSLLDPAYAPSQLSDAAFGDAIRNGVDERLWEFGPMPANGALNDAQIDAIIAYVRARQAELSAG